MSFALTEKEKEALLKFRERIDELKLNDFQKQDHYLIRWLRARELNIENAFQMLKKSIEWRKENDVDVILTQWKVPTEMIEALPYKVSGRDNDGCFIFVCPTGYWDIRDLCDRGYKEKIVKSTAHFLEMIEEFNRVATKEGGKPITQMLMINDMEGYSMRQLLSSDVRESNIDTMKVLEANFPEILNRSIVVNAPKVFTILFNLIKPILSARTLSKVSIYDSNRDKWVAALLNGVNPDELPAYYGGTNTSCPNHLVEHGYHVLPRGPELPADLLKPVTVPAGQTVEVPFVVDTAGTTLSWNFKTEEYDIGFRFLYEDSVVYSSPRADSHKFTMKGIHVCEKPGKYTLVFDNKYSKMRGKTVHYYVSTKKANNNDD